MRALTLVILLPGLVLAQGYAPRGSSGISPCGVTMTCAALSYTSTITDGTAGFIATGYGRILQGPGSCTGLAVDPNTGYMALGGLGCASVVTLGDTHTLQQGQYSLVGRMNLVGAGANVLLGAANLDTCTSGNEGEVMRDATSGSGATGHATRICVCRSDGSGIYKWWNVFSIATTGTTTTCPD